MRTAEHLNCYAVLGLPAEASVEQIKERYRQIAHKLHPDVNNGNPIASREFIQITDAYKILIDPQSRRQHDVRLQEIKRQAEEQQKWNEARKILAQWQQQKVAGTSVLETNASAHEADNARSPYYQPHHMRQKRRQVKKVCAVLLLLVVSWFSFSLLKAGYEFLYIQLLPASIPDDILVSRANSVSVGDSVIEVFHTLKVAPMSVWRDDLQGECAKPPKTEREAESMAQRCRLHRVIYDVRGDGDTRLCFHFAKGKLTRISSYSP